MAKDLDTTGFEPFAPDSVEPELNGSTEVQLNPVEVQQPQLNPPYTRVEAGNLLGVSNRTVSNWLTFLADYHAPSELLTEDDRISANGLDILKSLKDQGRKRYAENHAPIIKPASEANGKLTVYQGDAPLQTLKDRAIDLSGGQSDLDNQHSLLSAQAQANRKATDNQLEAMRQNRQGFVGALLTGYEDFADAISAQGQRLFLERLAENEAEFQQKLSGMQGSAVNRGKP